MKAIIKTGLSILLFLAGLSGQASGFENGSQKVIDQPFPGDLYVGGRTVLVNAGIAGDLVAAGGTISINDSITGDALLAGGNLLVNGAIGDDIRGAISLGLILQAFGAFINNLRRKAIPGSLARPL